MPEEFRVLLFNVILRKANLKALQLEEEMKLSFTCSNAFFKKTEDKSSDK